MGFQKKQSVLDDFEDDDFNLDDDLFDDESEIEEPEEYFDKLKESNKKTKSIKNPNTKDKKNDTKVPKQIIICAGVVIACVVVITGFLVVKHFKSYKQNQQTIQDEQSIEVQANGSTTEKASDYSAGAPNLNANTKKDNTSTVEDGSKLVSDLNGKQVPANFNAKAIKVVRDYVDYVKHRSVYPNGVEVYWLETSYKDATEVPTQVPYSIYKELDDKGITVCDIEVTTTADGQEIVTNMSVVKDSKSLINKNKGGK